MAEESPHRPDIVLNSIIIEDRRPWVRPYVSFNLSGENYRFPAHIHSAQSIMLESICKRLGGAVYVVIDDPRKPRKKLVGVEGEVDLVDGQKLPGLTKSIIRNKYGVYLKDIGINNKPNTVRFYVFGKKRKQLKETLLAALQCRGFWLENYETLYKATRKVEKKYEVLNCIPN